MSSDYFPEKKYKFQSYGSQVVHIMLHWLSILSATQFKKSFSLNCFVLNQARNAECRGLCDHVRCTAGSNEFRIIQNQRRYHRISEHNDLTETVV